MELLQNLDFNLEICIGVLNMYTHLFFTSIGQ